MEGSRVPIDPEARSHAARGHDVPFRHAATDCLVQAEGIRATNCMEKPLPEGIPSGRSGSMKKRCISRRMPDAGLD